MQTKLTQAGFLKDSSTEIPEKCCPSGTIGNRGSLKVESLPTQQLRISFGQILRNQRIESCANILKSHRDDSPFTMRDYSPGIRRIRQNLQSMRDHKASQIAITALDEEIRYESILKTTKSTTPRVSNSKTLSSCTNQRQCGKFHYGNSITRPSNKWFEILMDHSNMMAAALRYSTQTALKGTLI